MGIGRVVSAGAALPLLADELAPARPPAASSAPIGGVAT
jgi:hypothetical protein